MRTVIIYVLIDPLTNDVKYVGKTTNIAKRLNRHINESKKSTTSHKKAWIKSLLKRDLEPAIEVIDEILEEDWRFWESYWIEQFKCWGFNLTNETSGGDGVDKGNVPWNKGVIGSIKSNKTTFKKGNEIGKETRIKKGERLSPKTEFKKGQIPVNSKKVNQYDLEGSLIKEFNSYGEAARNIGVNTSAIQNCIRRGTFKCKGYIWEVKG